MEAYEFLQKCSLPYEAKVIHAKQRAREFFDHCDGNVFVSVGGLDSITLTYFLRKFVNADIPAVSVSSLEDKTVQEVHRMIPNMTILKPEKSKVDVIREFGYPVISKDKASKIELIQNPTERNATVRNAICTGQTGKLGGFKYSRHMKLPNKWDQLFIQQEAPFKVSPKCCYYMKEKPCDKYARGYRSMMVEQAPPTRVSFWQRLHGRIRVIMNAVYLTMVATGIPLGFSLLIIEISKAEPNPKTEITAIAMVIICLILVIFIAISERMEENKRTQQLLYFASVLGLIASSLDEIKEGLKNGRPTDKTDV
jgi:hypothetical protein